MEQPVPAYEFWNALEEGETPKIQDLLAYVRHYGLTRGNFEELVPLIIRACRRDECARETEELIRMWNDIDWNWYPNG